MSFLSFSSHSGLLTSVIALYMMTNVIYKFTSSGLSLNCKAKHVEFMYIAQFIDIGS